jgi:phage tail-like protein
VCDSGNGRLQLLSLPELRLTESWNAAGHLVVPVSVAVDSDGNAYVADIGANALEKMDVLGRRDLAFAETVAALNDLAPTEVAVGEHDGADALYVLDGTTARVHVLDADGHRLDRWETGVHDAVGLAAAGKVCLGDNAGRRVLVFAQDGRPIGAARGYSGPVGAVALVGADLLVHAGTALPPLRLEAGGYGTHGLLWGGPFPNPSRRSDPRHLIRARLGALQQDAHFQLFVHTQSVGDPPPPVDPAARQPFADPRWRAVAPDSPETLLQGAFGDELWLGLTLSGEGLSSPVLEQIRVDFAYETLLQYLPALFRRDKSSAELLARWLTVFDSAFDRSQAAIELLPRLFDPRTAPSAWLPWLAEWLALDLPESWSERRRRRAIAAAFEQSGRRGTVDGLRAAITSETGVEVMIEEPIAQANWWSLADEQAASEGTLSVLGVTTVLAAAEAQGAVAGTTAVLEGSFVAPQEEYARPLFAELAHRFTVRVYRGRTYSDDGIEALRVFLERERPAHTAYHICVVEPRLQVGVQARIGVDAIVGGDAEATRLDDAGEAGIVLGGPALGSLGVTTSVGRVRLTDSTRDR